MANCCEESKNKCNLIVNIEYLKDFVDGTGIEVTTPQGKNDGYCPTYEELISGRIVPITDDSITDYFYARDGIYVNPTPYTAPSASSGCCPSSNGNKTVRVEDLSLSYYNLIDFNASITSTTSLCNATGWWEGGYKVVKNKKSIDHNGCSETTSTDSMEYEVPDNTETHGANICESLAQGEPGDEVFCHTDSIKYDTTLEVYYPNKGETYSSEGSYTQEGMDLNIEWFNGLAEEIIETDGTSGNIVIGSVSSSENVTIGEPTVTASFSPQSVAASVEDGQIMLNVGQYINTEDRNITVSLPYTVCNTNYAANSLSFTQSGRPFVPSTKSPSCYDYTSSSITSCESQLYLCNYDTNATNHMTNWAYIDGMRLKVDEDGYFNEQIEYSEHAHHVNSGGSTAIDSNQERLGQHINAHAVYSADTDEANATFHVVSSRTQTNENMFEGVSDLVVATLPCEVDTIGASSFTDCISLEEYRNINQIEYIKNNAFENCSSLKVIGGGSSLEYIGEYAFHNCTTPTSVTLASSVSHIGRNAFENCTNVEEVTLPSGLRTINEETFKDCTSLETINIENITTINRYAFENCSSLTGVSFNKTNGVDIGEYAFLDCESLEYVYVTRGTIGDFAFENCTSLTGATIDNYVDSIGSDIFNGCDSLTYLGYYSSLPFDNDIVGKLDVLNQLQELSIGDSTSVGTKEIGDDVFKMSETLTSLTIGDSVESIGDNAFFACTGLTSVSIGDGVTSIGRNAFAYCISLTSVSIGDGVTSIGREAFTACRSLDDVTIPDSVDSIGDNAFADCALTSIYIPSNVTSIGISPFSQNYLTEISVDSSNTFYDSRDNCNAIIETATNELIQGCNNTVIPNTVTSIGYTAFDGCNSLESIEIPSSVTEIGTYAFINCENLTSATVLATTPPTAGTLIFSTSFIQNIYVPASSVDAYKSASGWSNYRDIIQPIQ